MAKYLKKMTPKTSASNLEVQETVAEIIETISARGDEAVLEYSKKFDNWAPNSFRVDEAQIAVAEQAVSALDKQTISFAQDQIRRFAQSQFEVIQDFEMEMFPGVVLGQKTVPIHSSGSYVPGGSYPITASANMSIIPAVVAGVKRVVAVTPPFKGALPSRTIYAMASAGAHEIYCLGGVQAVVAMAVGTESINPVDIIVGPGNKYVAEAKRQLFGKVGIDLFAGPSEVLIIADHTADPAIVAADLLAQCEHGVESEAVLITLSEELGIKVMGEMEKQLLDLPTREVASICWQNRGEIVVAENHEEALELGDFYASEHVEIQTENHEWYLQNLTNYGSLFLGPCTTVALGDKGIGTNHILPTLKAGRYTGGLAVGKFLKTLTYQYAEPAGLKYVAPYCSLSCGMEGMIAHKRSIDIRLEKYGLPIPE
ncbi:MAG TPA: histidinol dehydrogenase [Syntrophomonas sp.]|nr:histidinol dehydrogenase [Syntrophomonas sp.]